MQILVICKKTDLGRAKKALEEHFEFVYEQEYGGNEGILIDPEENLVCFRGQIPERFSTIIVTQPLNMIATIYPDSLMEAFDLPAK